VATVAVLLGLGLLRLARPRPVPASPA